ncbi:MAG: glycosyltransferase family 2 protein [Bdellovibrionales bacterium]|nr:glycosyltransferase family 2 protein [Bdellovibrionales bacterium]
MRGISVVIPIYNEEENVAPCLEELLSVLSTTGEQFEILFIDDGSSDGTREALAKAARGRHEVKLIEFRRNFGQTAAMAAGFDHARYEFVIPMDGDLQNDPREIPKMIALMDEGYDLVAGWRKDRQDTFLTRKLPSRIANGIISWATGVKLHDYGCTLKVMRREVAQNIKLYGEMHRFIPALAAEFGAKIVEVPVNHRARVHGTSKYGISRTIRVILDLLTVKFLLGYSKRPIHLFGPVGLVSGFIGFGVLTWMSIGKIFLGIPMGNRPLLFLGVLLVLIGIQFLVFGLLAEVLARTYYESQAKPIYMVRTMRNFGRGGLSVVSGADLNAPGANNSEERAGRERLVFSGDDISRFAQ